MKIKLVCIVIFITSLYADVIDFTGKPIYHVLFSDTDFITEVLVSLIQHEKKELKTAIFYLSDNRIINAFIDAKNHGAHVSVIVDKQCLTNLNFKNLLRLLSAHIDIRYFKKKQENSHGLMHHKYCLFESTTNNKRLVWTGSFNFTYSAQQYNKENALIIENEHLFQQYKANFNNLYKQTAPLPQNKKFARWLKKQFTPKHKQKLAEQINKRLMALLRL